MKPRNIYIFLSGPESKDIVHFAVNHILTATDSVTIINIRPDPAQTAQDFARAGLYTSDLCNCYISKTEEASRKLLKSNLNIVKGVKQRRGIGMCGEVVDSIIKRAEKDLPDVVIVGRRKNRNMFEESVSDAVLRRLHVAVMVIHI